MEKYFEKFRRGIIGQNDNFKSPYGTKEIIYADWIASGRLYQGVEDKISKTFGPFVANTHTETSETGTIMTHAYHHAKEIIRKHVNGSINDIVITDGFGMTGVVNKFQRILGLKQCNRQQRGDCSFINEEKPVVFITHMEHHSNHTSWYETNVDVVILPPNDKGLVDLKKMDEVVAEYADRKKIIGSFSACSNVTGIETPYHEMAAIMHKYGGLCFVDFAASAPYVDIDMHPEDKNQALDAVFFSPHKFLGGPGTSGVLVFNKDLYSLKTPDHPGGGTVDWTNAWGEYKYVDNIEAREDGGTPGFLQAIRTALCINLKDQMGTANIRKREHELIDIAFTEMKKINDLVILADNIKDRIGAISFYIKDVHFNLVVKLLNDRFGIQVRGGCACAGTYGHFLLDVSYEESHKITDLINQGDLSQKPGWIRLSIHPTMTNKELYFICGAIKEVQENHSDWAKDYKYDNKTNEFTHIDDINKDKHQIHKWFDVEHKSKKKFFGLCK